MRIPAKYFLSAAAAAGVSLALWAFFAHGPGPTPAGGDIDVPELHVTRWIEPRLTSATAWVPCRKSRPGNRVLEHADCGSAYLPPVGVSLPTEACEKAMTTHGETLRLLVTHPVCIDAAVDRLGELAVGGGDARVWSDLSAACYVRAQYADRPSDLLRALDAAEKAVQADEALPAAAFNLALAQEALGFSTKAASTWKKTSELDASQWADEAKARATAIERTATRNMATQWSVNRQRFSEAIAIGDRRSLAQWIRPFPGATQKYLEEELLPAWADALESGNPDEAQRRLHEASVLATTLSELTHDPYMREIVARIETANSQELQWLRDGHKAFLAARQHDRAFESIPAEAAYAKASKAFGRARTPLRLGAEVGRAVQLSRFNEDSRRAKQILSTVEAESRAHGYLQVRGRAEANLANIFRSEGDFLGSLDTFDVALECFNRMKDPENLSNVHVRKAGVLRALGHDDAALSETFRARKHAANLVEMAARHVLAGETAGAVLALDFPKIAFEYQSDFIDTLEREASAARGDESTTKAIRVNRAIALRGRAAIRLHLGETESAQAELDYANEVAGTQKSSGLNSDLKARIAEARGEAAMLAKDANAAIEAFTEAIELAGSTQYRTFQTILLTRRAEAYALAGNQSAAAKDLRDAIAKLNEEETDLLNRRRRGQGEGLWGSYFSRFQESYFRLIRLLIATRSGKEAFAYAEKSRAFEPLKLVLGLQVSDELLRSFDTKFVNPATLGIVQAALPEGTFLLEYQVGEHSTFAFIVSKHEFDVRELPVGKQKITEWSQALQREAVVGDANGFNRLLPEPYEALFAAPLGLIADMKYGQLPDRRLVIVPDRFMHGLPFSALRDGKGFHLMEKFVISVTPSAALYVHALARDRQLRAAGGDRKVLSIGNPAFNPDLELARGLFPLSFAETEAQIIGGLYGDEATVLVKKQATVPAFLALAKESAIIHVAGHAIVNRQPPFGTLLLMAPAQDHNGLLYAEELLTKLELDRARLVVLAACSSAGGVPVGPEGLAPLVRPLIAAGVPGVVGSLWTIRDRGSQLVMVEFHQQYRSGHDAARALQLAQLRYLRESDTAMPALTWASFQVVGYSSSPFLLNYHH